jgi:hypothetical protein
MSNKTEQSSSVIPAEAGIQAVLNLLDSGSR